jgi:UDP-glucose-4-epimerase GalE
MRILVTGGAGYVGSHTARVLARRGHEVVVFDNLSTGHRFLANGFHLIVEDIGDSRAVAAALHGVDAVLHFAAHAYVGESVQDPRKYFENNVRSGLAFLNAVLESRVRQFVFSSTCAIYGAPAKIPIREDDVRQPMNPYGVSKLFFENALEAYNRAYGLNYVCLRYFNAAGADEQGEIGELHEPETHLIPCILRTAAGLRPNFEVYGEDYPTPDGTCVRDFIHVGDLAEAHALALEYLAKGGDSVALNLGTGEGHSVTEVIRMVEEITGRPVAKRMCPRRPGDPPILVADPSRALQVLQWKAARSLPTIISTAWNWMQTNQRRHVRT